MSRSSTWSTHGQLGTPSGVEAAPVKSTSGAQGAHLRLQHPAFHQPYVWRQGPQRLPPWTPVRRCLNKNFTRTIVQVVYRPADANMLQCAWREARVHHNALNDSAGSGPRRPSRAASTRPQEVFAEGVAEWGVGGQHRRAKPGHRFACCGDVPTSRCSRPPGRAVWTWAQGPLATPVKLPSIQEQRGERRGHSPHASSSSLARTIVFSPSRLCRHGVRPDPRPSHHDNQSPCACTYMEEGSTTTLQRHAPPVEMGGLLALYVRAREILTPAARADQGGVARPRRGLPVRGWITWLRSPALHREWVWREVTGHTHQDNSWRHVSTGGDSTTV